MKNWLRDQIKSICLDIDFDVLTPSNEQMGDYSINLPFVLAKKDKVNPVEVGGEILTKLEKTGEFLKYFSKVEFAPPGFINFHFSENFLRNQVKEILSRKEEFGDGTDKKIKINLEFVSANPTGPLTVANVRAASFGDTLAGIFRKAGYTVSKEYYINDAGNQVRLLGESVARRYLRLKGKTIDFPDNLYQGEYIIDIAREIEKGEMVKESDNFDELVIFCREYAVKKLIESAKKSLQNLGVEFDVWFSENEFRQSGEVESALKILESGNHIYEKDGARWLRIDDSGEHDAVVVKSDGTYAYVMPDIAYTRNKFIRGFDRAINIWGTDHHGDVPRLLTGVKSLGYEDGKLEILLHQLVFIKSGGETQRMSKRKGEFVLLDDLLKEVGKDPIRFFFLMKDLNTHMEFDIDLAKEQSKKNPVFYIQYAYARLSNIFDKSGVGAFSMDFKNADVNLLKEVEELRLMRKMVKFPELVGDIAGNYQVHALAQYTFDLAADFHNFYEKYRVINDDKKLEESRLALCRSVQIVLNICLKLMGLSAPNKM